MRHIYTYTRTQTYTSLGGVRPKRSKTYTHTSYLHIVYAHIMSLYIILLYVLYVSAIDHLNPRGVPRARGNSIYI